MKGYLDEIEDRAMAKGKIIGAVSAFLTMDLDFQAIKAKINRSYPNFEQKKLDQIIAEQKKELGLS